MRRHITEKSCFEADVIILYRCPRLTKMEIDVFLRSPKYVKELIYSFNNSVIDKNVVKKLLRINPELLEFFI